jgi:hypothetical protein
MPRWTPESRARQAALTGAQKPWQHSTGPRTKRGKEKSKCNALKHGTRSEEWREFLRVLRMQREFVKTLHKIKYVP